MSATAAANVDEPAERLREWLADGRFGSLRPLDVRLRRDEDPDEQPAWFLDVELPHPEPGETWPLDDLVVLHGAVRDKALELGVAWPWYVSVRPDIDEEPEEPEEPEDLDDR